MSFLLIGFIFSFFSCAKSGVLTVKSHSNSKSDSSTVESSNIPSKLLKLIKSYPDFLDSAEENNIYWKDGTVMNYDDGIKNK